MARICIKRNNIFNGSLKDVATISCSIPEFYMEPNMEILEAIDRMENLVNNGYTGLKEILNIIKSISLIYPKGKGVKTYITITFSSF